MNTNDTLNLRIKHTSDSSDNWKSIEDTFTPKQGEMIVYTDGGGKIKAKIGDGETFLKDLPFVIDRPITEDEIKGIVNGTT